MAHTKSGGSTNLGRDSQSKRLGVKISDGQNIRPGQVIVRQRGTKIHPGINVRRGADDTLYATAQGLVRFHHRRRVGITQRRRWQHVVSVIADAPASALTAV